MTTNLVAFIDESKKPVRDPATGRVAGTGDHYVVAAAVVLSGDLDDVRGALVAATQALGFPFHYADLRSRSRRLAALDAILAIDAWDAFLFETARPMSPRHNSEHHLRSKTLAAALRHLSTEVGTSRVVLETRAHPGRGLDQLDRKDHQVLQRLISLGEVAHGLSLGHVDKAEPVLQVSDVLAGVRTDHLCSVDRELYARVAHRVQKIVTVLDR